MNKSQLIDAVAADSGLTKADSARAIESLLGHGHEDAEKRRRGQHHGLRQVLRRQTGRPSGRQPAHRRAGQNQSLEGPQVLRRRRPQAGCEPEEEISDSAPMALVSELELPAFDYTDPSMRGERFHEAMARAARAGLARAGAVRLHRARPRVRRVLPAHTLGDLPGDEDRRDLRRHRGAAVRADAAQHPARQRPRPLAAAQPRQPRAVAARGRALPRRRCAASWRSCSSRRSRRRAGRRRGAARASAASSSRRSPSRTRRR